MGKDPKVSKKEAARISKYSKAVYKISRLNALLEAIQSSPSRINKILVQKGTRRTQVEQILKAARRNNVPFLFVPKKKLDSLDRNHQGAIAFLSPKSYSSLEDILQASPRPFLLLLDGIEDPQNLGAIVRTAEAAGVNGIILPERRSAGITESVAAVSAGALEHVRITRVKNLARTMDALKERGIWLVGAEGGQKDLWFDFDFKMPLGLVFGSEGKGLRPLVRKKCDKILSLPLQGKISSLNVASAAAVFIFEVVRQRGNKK
jgi:23S rRNA (guanosine2251-2'-O)-methyltransferase